jgi:kinesin family member 5
MYEKVAKQTIDDFMHGYNGTIFAYGQSGSGKTFSMLGPEDVTEALSKDFNSVPESVTQLYGITPRAVIQMFQTINSFVAQGSQCTLICSYIEIYNETIKCLLSKKDNLKIREQPGMGMNVADKEVRVCRTPEEIFECVSLATKNRAVTGTNQNARSSRSHTILLLEFEYNGIDGVKRSSRLNLVDLAGSERVSKNNLKMFSEI